MAPEIVKEEVEPFRHRPPEGEISVGRHPAAVAEKDSRSLRVTVATRVNARSIGRVHFENRRWFGKIPINGCRFH